MVRYLVTGGAGFIGSHLCDLLVARGAAVVAVDDLSTGCRANLAQLAGNDRFRLIVGSATNARLMDRLVREADVVVHLAAAVGVELIRSRPLSSARTNALATLTVLKQSVRHRRRVLLASSSEVYGYTAPVPVAEDTIRTSGAAADMRASYGASKAFEESVALACAHQEGLPVVVARLFNTVGPRQRADHGMVIPRFVEHALARRPLRVLGDGRQTRSFGHVLDVVDALQRLAEAPAATGDVFNVGRPEEVAILDLAHRIMTATGGAVPVELVPYPDDFRESRRRVPDVTKIRACVGWEPRRDLDTIIRDVVAERRGTAAPVAVA
ncbi:MAG TPA: GDP-mannose 4,6-dehydratase [Solirubrobacteraceae bacterium]|nr:GDP-mannose 4,6-dehydratase [Solirubrobacteraceae bacterium]